MNHLHCVVNDSCSWGKLRRSLQRARYSWALNSFWLIAMGCGSAVEDKHTPTAQADPLLEANVAAATDGAPTRSSAGPAQPQKRIAVPSPTPEQIKRWSPEPFEPLQLLAFRQSKDENFATCVAPTPDGEHFIVVGSRILLLSVKPQEPEHVLLDFTPADKDRVIGALAVSPDGKWFAVGDSTGMVRIWSLADRQEIVAKKLGSTGIQSLAISPDAQEIATISYTSDVTISNSTSLEPLKKFKVNTSGLKRVEYMAPKMLAAAGESTSLWDTSSGELVQELSPGRYSFALERSPDAARFIFGSKDSLRIWNVADSKQEAEIAEGVSGTELLSFSPDGEFLATTNGRTIQLWNLAERRTAQVIDSFGWPIVGLSWLPETNLLVVASDVGCMRIWGKAGQGAKLGLAPTHPAPVPKEADPNAPATLTQMQQVIDLRIFPRLPDCKPSIAGIGEFHCIAPVSIQEAHSFYKYFLEKEGWAPAESPAAQPDALEFRKNGYTISVHCYDAGDGKTNIMVNNAGNYDLRRTPKFDAVPVETVYEAANTVSYRTKADIVQIETALLRKLHAAGWTGYSRLNSSHAERTDERDLNFLRAGTTLRVSVNKSPDQPNRFNIQYSLFSNNASVPVPPDSGFVEFDGSTQPLLVATTKLPLDQAEKFYQSQLAEQGWSILETGRSTDGDHLWLSGIRNQSNLTISLTRLPDGRTVVRVGQAVGSLWELSQKKEDKSDKSEVEGLEAADFPVLDASHSITFDANEKSIDVTIKKTTLASAAEQFTKALAKLDWKAEDGGIRDEDYTLLTFKKGKKEISLRARSKDGNAVVNFQGDGLLWNNELPQGKQIVSYETWLRQNKLPAGLEMLDQYEVAMRAIQGLGH